ncbi:MAG TPA: hypothetical protein VFW06_03210 [Acidimicrobiia bacterium]|nr:hypothetical protein [Acidimicrobiia bacterium]
MAGFGITHFFEGGTREQYETTVAVVHPDGGKGLPPGETYHAAGPAEGGWQVIAMWDSKASYESFRDGTLGPTLATLDGALPGAPEERAFEVHNEVSG